jgi:hypothetical protein
MPFQWKAGDNGPPGPPSTHSEPIILPLRPTTPIRRPLTPATPTDVRSRSSRGQFSSPDPRVRIHNTLGRKKLDDFPII